MKDIYCKKGAEITELIAETGSSRAAFARKYGVPIRTLENWASGARSCPEYVMSLLKRCVRQAPAALDGNPMPLKDLRAACGMSRAEFSKEYGIPVRTLENWESDANKCPPYVAELLERCVRFDHFPVYFCIIHLKDGGVEHTTERKPIDGWYISRSQRIYYLKEREINKSRGFNNRHKCELEKNKLKRKLAPAERQGREYEYFVMRLEEVRDMADRCEDGSST